MCIWQMLADLRAENEHLRAQSRKHMQQMQQQLSEKAEIEPQYECRICMDKPIQSVFLPCGHCMACMSCARAVTRCPVCSESVVALTPIYLG
jgi:rubrerythrin